MQGQYAIDPANVYGRNSMAMQDFPFDNLARKLLRDLSSGQCVAVTGLSNSGKTTLLRSLCTPAAVELYHHYLNRSARLIYIDCNRAVDLSAQAFYEVVLRSILENIDDIKDPEFLEKTQTYYQSVTEVDSSFNASLAFNLALSEVCAKLDMDLCLVIDEFDELYASLDERSLLNLRALRDRFADRLRYLTATVRGFMLLRGRHIEGEFAELFSHSKYSMPLLDPDESENILKQLEDLNLNELQVEKCIELSGGHPGMLLDVAQVLGGLQAEQIEHAFEVVRQSPQPRSESLKIWGQLTEAEQASITTLVMEAEAKLPGQHMNALEEIGLVKQGEVFSPLFADFVFRRSRSSQVSERGIHLDNDSGDVWVDGVRIPVLTDLEFRLLRLMYDRQDMITDKYKIVTGVWGEDYLGDVDDARVEKLVSRLRSKIEPDPSNPCYLLTQRGRGYKLVSRPLSIEK
jgi:DNA-binding winged helix-turn-helix (wHTH) protein